MHPVVQGILLGFTTALLLTISLRLASIQYAIQDIRNYIVVTQNK